MLCPCGRVAIGVDVVVSLDKNAATDSSRYCHGGDTAYQCGPGFDSRAYRSLQSAWATFCPHVLPPTLTG